MLGTSLASNAGALCTSPGGVCNALVRNIPMTRYSPLTLPKLLQCCNVFTMFMAMGNVIPK